MNGNISNIEHSDLPVGCDSSTPAVKILDVMEYFSVHTKPSSLAHISRQTGIAQATLLRILSTLLARGYVARNADKQYSPKYQLTREDSIPAALSEILMESLRNLIAAQCDSAEIITLRDTNLFWHEKMEQNELPVRVAVKPGSTRTIYELDAPTRLFLKYLGSRKAAQYFDTTRFYDVSYQPKTWRQSQNIFIRENLEKVTFDRAGNSNGIRRFATLLVAEKIPFVLSVAEAALPQNNTNHHIRAVKTLLQKERRTIQEHMNKEKYT
jgi:DNA-binding IclR family transcriptional regulator